MSYYIKEGNNTTVELLLSADPLVNRFIRWSLPWRSWNILANYISVEWLMKWFLTFFSLWLCNNINLSHDPSSCFFESFNQVFFLSFNLWWFRLNNFQAPKTWNLPAQFKLPHNNNNINKNPMFNCHNNLQFTRKKLTLLTLPTYEDKIAPGWDVSHMSDVHAVPKHQVRANTSTLPTCRCFKC